MKSKLVITDTFFWQRIPARSEILNFPLSLAEGKRILKFLRGKVEIIGQCYNKNIFDIAFQNGIHPLEYNDNGFKPISYDFGDCLFLLDVSNDGRGVKINFRVAYLRPPKLNLAPMQIIES